MARPARSNWLWVVGTLVCALAVAMLAGAIARHRAMAALAASTRVDAQLRASLLDSEIARYRLVPLALADDRDVVDTLAGRRGAADALDRKLEALARTTGASVLYLVDRQGIALAASNWNTRASFVGARYGFRRYVRDALAAGSGAQYAMGTVSRRPGLFLSRRTNGGGVIVIKLEFDRVEKDWRRAGGDTFVEDARGIVVVTSRPAWRFAATRPLSRADLAAVHVESSLPAGMVRPLRIGGERVSQTVPTAYPGWTLTLSRAAEGIERPAARAASIGAGLAVIALAALGWGSRQRALLNRRRTAELEEAVATRTAELTREMDERAASEVRAAELREGLRQANRLATLGQVTASVAHETAQPVAAIRTYAQTSATLLDQGDGETVRANLAAIARLADRIGAVTSELRGFARRRTDHQRPVLLADIVDGARLILKEQLRSVRLVAPAIDPTLAVWGGKVRLEQVLVNVLQNALEATRGQAEPAITLDLAVEERRLVLGIQDNGPGIGEDVARRLFTPFVTSRPDGLGLGLVIAHDIMIEFGGALRHVPGPAGARFEIEMVRP
ncbi:sensor histidine kinase [Sphingomonas morindae]|uniref:histidine kinase n=1 Tax=Sphingomonas morindae TaxID=1541170 RepID=A0ABY4XDW3_9SPHN|nr:ATP-binding protein [Sphingomonas morindae]USI75048.1 sensor histidine kinase [Sphingomonas morindae]